MGDQKEMVHHPDHYQGVGGLEVWEVQKAFTAGLTGVIAGDACAIIKYACRWHKKNGVEDLKKIIEYAQHLIKELEEECLPPMELTEEELEEETRRHLIGKVSHIYVSDEKTAIDVVSSMNMIIHEYGYASVNDFLDIVGLGYGATYQGQNYGWADSNNSFRWIRCWTDNGVRFLICVPSLKKLNKEKESN